VFDKSNSRESATRPPPRWGLLVDALGAGTAIVRPLPVFLFRPFNGVEYRAGNLRQPDKKRPS
jgi:hypothetical protein